MTTTQPGGIEYVNDHRVGPDAATSVVTVERPVATEHTDERKQAKAAADRRLKPLRMFAGSITLFTLAGHLVLGFEQAPITPIVTVLYAYIIDVFFERLDARATGRAPRYAGGFGALVTFLLPTHIAGMATAMLLWGNQSLWPYLFAVTIAVVSKHFITIRVRGRRRHFLNPSNFGIAVTLILFPWVGIAPPYHFTNDVTDAVNWLVPLGVLMAGTMLNVKLTGKWPLILGWVGGFAAQAVIRWLVLDHSLGAALLPMTGVAFILFTNYMITDPGTTPFTKRNQVIFGVTTAAVYGILVTSHVVFGLFFALTITCILRAVVLVATPSCKPILARMLGTTGANEHGAR